MCQADNVKKCIVSDFQSKSTFLLRAVDIIQEHTKSQSIRKCIVMC